VSSQPISPSATRAPAISDSTKAGTSDGRMPAKVSVKPRAMATAGLAKLVEAVNQ
jgi:hypothetical protein